MRINIDVEVNGNEITGRQGLAYVFNSGEMHAIRCDLDKKQEYRAYKEYSEIKVYDERRDLKSVGTVFHNLCNGQEFWEIAGYGCCLHASFGFHNKMEMLDQVNLPVLKKDDIVAVVEFSKEEQSFSCKLFRVGKVDIFCSTMATLKPLTDDEMIAVRSDVIAWVNRRV